MTEEEKERAKQLLDTALKVTSQIEVDQGRGLNDWAKSLSLEDAQLTGDLVAFLTLKLQCILKAVNDRLEISLSDEQRALADIVMKHLADKTKGTE